MRNWLWTLIILLVFLAFGTPHQANADPFIVGVSIPLTGDVASAGTAVSNGIVLAGERLPDVTRRVQFVFEDNRYEARQSITAFRSLVDTHHVRAIYNWGEPPLHAIAPLAEREEVPVLAMSLDPVPSEGKLFSLLSINPARDYASTLVPSLRSRGFKKFKIVAAEDPFISAMVDGFRSQLKGDESLSVVATVLPTETDFRSIVSQVSADTYDALGVYLMPGQVSTFFRQSETLGRQIPAFGTDCFEDTEEIRLAGPRMAGAVYAQIDVPEWFQKAYRQRFNSDSHVSFAYNAYVFAAASAQVAELGLKNPREIMDAYKAFEDSQLAVSRGTISESKGQSYWKFPLIVKRIAP